MATKSKWRLVHEGAESQVYQMNENDEEYHLAIDDHYIFGSRPKAIKKLREYLRNEITVLKQTLKRIK